MPAPEPQHGLLTALLTRGGSGPEPVAEGVWRVQGEPGRMNVLLLDDGAGGLTLFDAGGRTMVAQVRAAIAALGRPLREVVLGHGHTDHRGTAPFLGVPVRCHADEVEDATGSGGRRYWDLGALPQPTRSLHRGLLHPRVWDGGPVAIADVVREGDRVAGFEVVHLPGHAPGLIALWRARDRLALTSDAFYGIDLWGRDAPAHVPEGAYNHDTAQARASLRKLADLEPAIALPGHGDALTGDVAAALRAT